METLTVDIENETDVNNIASAVWKIREQNRTKQLINDLIAGENSGMITHFDRKKYLKNLHEKYLNK
jgi:hypothetical protein